MPDENNSQAGEDQTKKKAPKKKASKKRATKKRAAKKKAPKKKASKKKAAGGKRTRTVRTFPATKFEDALVIPQAIQQYAAGQKVRRLTLFDKLGKSPDSGPSRQLITNSSKYGLTTGSYSAEHIELTDEGRTATGPEVSQKDMAQARFKLAISDIEPFKVLYERYKNNKLPAQAVLRDTLLEHGNDEAEVAECVDTFVLNAKFLGILRQVAGAERLVTIEHAIEELEGVTPPVTPGSDLRREAKPPEEKAVKTQTTWNRICFYIAPIGEPDSEQRKHSDLFLSNIVEPALEEFKLQVVRADEIGEAGMITRQVIEHIVQSRLVIADLSYHNPNVFYELSLRHACRKPTVQLIRAADRIPFDLDQFRTIKVDTSSIYSLVPQLETYKSEIANQVRSALLDPDAVDNPISVFFPNLKTVLDS